MVATVLRGKNSSIFKDFQVRFPDLFQQCFTTPESVKSIMWKPYKIVFCKGMHQYNLLYFANYYTLSNVSSTELAIFTLIYRNVRDDDDGSYEQFSSSDSLLSISWFSSFSCAAFSLAARRILFAFARSISCCNFSVWSEKSSAEADRASASVCSALLFTFKSPTSSLRAFLFWHVITFDLALFCPSR